MQVHQTAAAYGQAVEDARGGGATVGLVPTMGALHAGHRSLIRRARAECDRVAVTVFVNPLQFGDPDDLAEYPRTLPADLEICAAEAVDLVLAPSVSEMYPAWPRLPGTVVSVRGVSERWEGEARPGHFDGVATVVAKLFSMTGRCRAYFGLKDFQQLVLVRQMAADLSMPVEVVGCATVREPDGLALSSRNARLSAGERRAARVLCQALRTGVQIVASGEQRPQMVAEAMARPVADQPLATLQYAAVVRADDLTVPPLVEDPARLRLLIAARVGPVRLIDNCAADDSCLGVDARR